MELSEEGVIGLEQNELLPYLLFMASSSPPPAVATVAVIGRLTISHFLTLASITIHNLRLTIHNLKHKNSE